MHLAAKRAGDPQQVSAMKTLIELLLRFGADKTLKDKYGDTALHVAEQYEAPADVLELLIDKDVVNRKFQKQMLKSKLSNYCV